MTDELIEQVAQAIQANDADLGEAQAEVAARHAISIIVARCASDVEAQADIIGAMPGSSIHSALKHAAHAIRKHGGTHDQG